MTTALSPESTHRRSSTHKYFTLDEEADLITRAQAGDASAMQDLLECHAGFIHGLARKWWNQHKRFLRYEDCFQEASLGAMRAINMHDNSKKVKLTTYAHWWIKSYLGKMRGEKQAIRVPLHVKKPAFVLSLNYVNGGFTEEFHESLISTRSDDSDVRDECEAKDTLTRLMQSLTKQRHRDVLQYRFSGLSLQQTGDILGLTRERVRQIELQAISRLKTEAMRLKLTYNGHFATDEPPPPRSHYRLPKPESQEGWVDDPAGPSAESLRGLVYTRDIRYVTIKAYLNQGCPRTQVKSLTGYSLKLIDAIIAGRKTVERSIADRTPLVGNTQERHLERYAKIKPYYDLGHNVTEAVALSGVCRTNARKCLKQYLTENPSAKCSCGRKLGHMSSCRRKVTNETAPVEANDLTR